MLNYNAQTDAVSISLNMHSLIVICPLSNVQTGWFAFCCVVNMHESIVKTNLTDSTLVPLMICLSVFVS
jgi:hypothetical protein